jgi:hypothetical protein
MVAGVYARRKFAIDARNIAPASDADPFEVRISHSKKEPLDTSTNERHERVGKAATFSFWPSFGNVFEVTASTQYSP